MQKIMLYVTGTVAGTVAYLSIWYLFDQQLQLHRAAAPIVIAPILLFLLLRNRVEVKK